MLSKLISSVLNPINKVVDWVFDLVVGKTSNGSFEIAQKAPKPKSKALIVVAAITTAVAAIGGIIYASRKGAKNKAQTQTTADNLKIAASQPQAMLAMAEDLPAADYGQNHWQNTVKSARGQAPEMQGAINPKMSIMPADAVQDLGAVTLGRK